jgi:N-acetyl-anhydromuramyl-L-alanine amidase AmpD
MILKVGSKGEAVKSLQTFLNITADGIFGKNTEAAVKQYQENHGLVPDGIVGKRTWTSMGLAATDNAERPDIIEEQDITLDIKKSYLPKGQYIEANVKKQWIFLHHTAGWQNPYGTISGWARDDRGMVATEFVIGGQSIYGNDNKYDGEVVQAFPAGSYGWHLGIGRTAMHMNSVGIEVCNFGNLKDGKTWAGGTVVESQIVKLKQKFKGAEYYHRYSDTQLKALKQLILFIAERDNIDPRKGIRQLIEAKGVFPAFEMTDAKYCSMNPGMYTHVNVFAGKCDMFPQVEVVDMIMSL